MSSGSFEGTSLTDFYAMITRSAKTGQPRTRRTSPPTKSEYHALYGAYMAARLGLDRTNSSVNSYRMLDIGSTLTQAFTKWRDGQFDLTNEKAEPEMDFTRDADLGESMNLSLEHTESDLKDVT
eukprot:747979-Hanusia_phi.AAC.4